MKLSLSWTAVLFPIRSSPVIRIFFFFLITVNRSFVRTFFSLFLIMRKKFRMTGERKGILNSIGPMENEKRRAVPVRYYYSSKNARAPHKASHISHLFIYHISHIACDSVRTVTYNNYLTRCIKSYFFCS